MTDENINNIDALIKEAAELPDPRRNLLSHNERELIGFCNRLASALTACAARLQAATS